MQRELHSVKRVEIRPDAFGKVDIRELIKVPLGKTVILSVRKKFGAMGLTLGACFAEPGYEGHLELQLTNRSGKLVEIAAGEAVVNFIVVEAFKDDIIVGE